MIKYILLILLSLSFLVSKSQIFFQTNFNSTFSGRNFNLTASKEVKNNFEIGGGIRINLFNLNGKLAHPDDQFNTFKKRLYMTKPIHFVGLSGFVNRQILLNWKTVRPYIFYDFQVSYSGTRNRFFLPYDVALDGTVLYKEHIRFRGPYTWMEQNIGIGFKANISQNFVLNQRIGFGTAFILGYEEELLGKYFNWFAWNFSSLFTIGLEYQINSK